MINAWMANGAAALALFAPFSGVPAASKAVGIGGTQGQGQPALRGSQFNPQISIVGDFAAVLKDDADSDRHADFREIEFGFAADADPFLRVEAYIALAKEDGETKVEVEEAFGRYSRLGRGLQAKVGKIAAAVGRVQRNHSDQLGYLNYPLVIQDVLGEEGMRAPGASLSYLFPGERFHELTAEILDVGDEGPVYSGSSLDDPVVLGRYRTFFDFSADLSGQLGLTALCGPNGPGSGRGQTIGVDYTMKWQPGQVGRSATFEGEAYWTKTEGSSRNAFGAFARLMLEVAPKWFATLGYDESELPGTDDRRHGYLAGLTRKVTEFHHWRLEWQRVKSNFESTRNLLTLQFQWIIGAHPAHRY